MKRIFLLVFGYGKECWWCWYGQVLVWREQIWMDGLVDNISECVAWWEKKNILRTDLWHLYTRSSPSPSSSIQNENKQRNASAGPNFAALLPCLGKCPGRQASHATRSRLLWGVYITNMMHHIISYTTTGRSNHPKLLSRANDVVGKIPDSSYVPGRMTIRHPTFLRLPNYHISRSTHPNTEIPRWDWRLDFEEIAAWLTRAKLKNVAFVLVFAHHLLSQSDG